MTGGEAHARFEARVAIEALRAGVPNRAAIRLLGDGEDAIEAAFDRGLDASDQPEPGRQEPGLLVAGGFGTGKSHLLGYLREVALQRNFVVSTVTISKETPLGTPRFVFAAALRNSLVPGRNDDAITVALGEVQRIQGAVQRLELWASTPEAGLAPVFAAILHLLNRQLDPELQRGIETFLAGGKLPLSLLRKALSQGGARGMFDLRVASEVQLLLQRQRFLPALFRAAGFAGWCVLLDEIELIGRYGPLQRALAYAELARWLGLDAESRVAGLFVAGAITDDFSQAVIQTRQDDEKLPERLRLKGLPRQAEQALTAMRAIEQARLLAPPDGDSLLRHAARLQDTYGRAYGWTAPTLAPPVRQANRTLRHHIRGWIAQWDVLRLEGQRAETDIIAQAASYEENNELATPPDDED